MMKINLNQIVAAIEYAREHKNVAGICAHPENPRTRMWSHHRPFVGKAYSLWTVPAEWWDIPMTKKRMMELAREVKERLTAGDE